MTELVFANTTEFAELLGVSDSYVRRLKRDGKLVLDGERIVVAASIAKLGRVLDPARGGDRTGKAAASSPPADGATGALPLRPSGPGIDYNVEAARERRAKAQLAELELMQQTGQLVVAAAVDARVFGMARAGREAIMALPDRLATLLAAESDAVKVHAMLTAECRKVCEHLANADLARDVAPLEAAA
ncbi:hypothetical protein [Lysobacter olei]